MLFFLLNIIVCRWLQRYGYVNLHYKPYTCLLMLLAASVVGIRQLIFLADMNVIFYFVILGVKGALIFYIVINAII